jgi:hypothetical protein
MFSQGASFIDFASQSDSVGAQSVLLESFWPPFRRCGPLVAPFCASTCRFFVTSSVSSDVWIGFRGHFGPFRNQRTPVVVPWWCPPPPPPYPGRATPAHPQSYSWSRAQAELQQSFTRASAEARLPLCSHQGSRDLKGNPHAEGRRIYIYREREM